MITLPVTEQAKQQEWNTILTVAKNNVFPLHIIHNLKNKLITKTQHTFTTQTHQKKIWITFTYYSPLIHKITNLLRHTNLNIAFHATDTVCKQLSDKIIQNKFKWNAQTKMQHLQ